MKRALADVLWTAANQRLWDGHSLRHGGEECYACFAIERVERDHGGPARMWFENDFGVPYHYQGHLDAEYGSRPKQQGVRYMLLLLAMHVAEDEGIEIEVAE